MAQPGFELLFQNLEQIGFFEFVLPLVLFMAIFYGALRKTEVIGDDEAVQGAAALALAFMTTFGIYTFIPFSFFPQFFGALSVLIVLILGMMILAGMAGYDVTAADVSDAKAQRYAIIGTILIVIITFPFAFQFLGEGIEITEAHANFVLTLALIAVIGFIISKFSPNSG